MSPIINIKTGFRAAIATAILAAALLVPAQAMAQQSCADAKGDPTAAQYCSVSGENAGGNNGVKGVETSSNEPAATETVVEEVPTAEEVAVESSSSSSLPFTGLDVGVLAIVAVALTGAGLLLRRLTASGVSRS